MPHYYNLNYSLNRLVSTYIHTYITGAYIALSNIMIKTKSSITIKHIHKIMLYIGDLSPISIQVRNAKIHEEKKKVSLGK